MALTEKRAEAESLYVRKSLTVPAIAETLGVDVGTVYRWKADAEKKGDSADWDARRRVFNLSPKELIAIYSETVKDWLIRIKENPDMLSDPKMAYAINTHISTMKKLDTRSQYLGAITDLIKVTNNWLAENQPELKKQLDPYWDSIYQELARYSTNTGLF
jgi:transposase-like protein